MPSSRIRSEDKRLSDLPADIAAQIDGFLTAGYASPEEVLREALGALESRDADLTAIREGLADETAGRVQPAREALAQIVGKQGLSAS